MQQLHSPTPKLAQNESLPEGAALKAAALRLNLFGPFAGGVKNAQDFHSVVAHSVRDDVRHIGNHQFSRALNAPRPTQRGMNSKQRYCSLNHRHHPLGSCRAIACNIVGFGLEVRECPPQPDDLERFSGHAALACALSICQLHAARLLRWRSRPDRPRPILF